MITKSDLKDVDPVILTKCLLAFNNIVRREIIEKGKVEKCIENSTRTPAERK